LEQNTASTPSPPENSIDDFISSTHIIAKQLTQEIKAAFAFMQSHLIFETVLVATLHPNPTPCSKHIWSELLKVISCLLWLQLLSFWKSHHGLLSDTFNNLQLKELREPSHDSKYNKVYAMGLGYLRVTMHDFNIYTLEEAVESGTQLMSDFNTV
jgi:hypothetical protein